MSGSDLILRRLFAVNVLLQLFDGLVTYQGLQLGFEEGNPLLRASFATLGVGPALLLYKAKACGFLVLLRRSVPAAVGERALLTVALAYTLGSVAPWLGMLLPILAI